MSHQPGVTSKPLLFPSLHASFKPVPSPRPAALAALARLFLRLGATAFGGPAVHIAMMEDEVVRRRQWLSREEFLDFVGAVNLIPGPNSTELAIHIGYRRAGWAGLLVAGACFILPAALIVTAVAWAYVRYGSLPQLSGILYGVKPVVIAIIAQAIWSLGRSAVRSVWLALVGLAAGAAALLGVNEILVLALCGFVVMLVRLTRTGVAASGWVPLIASLQVDSARRATGTGSGSVGAGATSAGIAGATVAMVSAPFDLWSLFTSFVRIGSLLFGSGYVLLALLQADFVDRMHWLTEQQLLDAIAIGQVTPGPLFTTATFIGYILGGASGAAVATIGIFLPAFVFVALSGAIIPRIRRSPLAGAFLDGVNVASLALMAVVTVELATSGVTDWLTLALAVVSAVLLLRYRVNSAWLILAGAAVGILGAA